MLNSYKRRKLRVRNKIAKCNKSARPRIVVFRSNKNIYAQLIDANGAVVKSSSTLSAGKDKKISGIEKAKLVGAEFAKLCLKDSITEAVFDKGSFAYRGRVKALAESCRESGLKF